MFNYKLKFKVDSVTPEFEESMRAEIDDDEIELIFDSSDNTVAFVLPSENELPEELIKAFTEIVARMCKESFPNSEFVYVSMTHEEAA